MRVGATLKELVKEYEGKVRVVFMNMVVHPDTVQLAHQYSCAAAKQGKFLDYMNAFWEKGFGAYGKTRDKSLLGEENILKFTGDMGFDTQKLKADANSAECKERVAADMAELRKFNVSGTPAFFINGKHVGGGIPKDRFKVIIDERLAVAEKSGVTGAEYYDKEIRGKGVHQFKGKRPAAGGGRPGPGGGHGPHDGHGH
jgi:protein-disulfide isomerase